MSKVSKDYLCITFFIMIICWGICVLCSINGYTTRKYPILYLPWLIGGLSPTIASYISLKKNGVVCDLKSWLKKVFDVRQSISFYFIAIIFSIIPFILHCLIAGFEIGMPFYALIVLLPLMLLGGGLEEAGWRMILQPELEKKYSFVVSTLIVSVIWWVWHLPLFFIQGTSQFQTNFFNFGLSIFASSFALAAIKNKTGSVFLCVFIHCLNNSLSSIFLYKGTVLSYCVSAMVLVIASIAFVKQNKLSKRI